MKDLLLTTFRQDEPPEAGTVKVPEPPSVPPSVEPPESLPQQNDGLSLVEIAQSVGRLQADIDTGKSAVSRLESRIEEALASLRGQQEVTEEATEELEEAITEVQSLEQENQQQEPQKTVTPLQKLLFGA